MFALFHAVTAHRFPVADVDFDVLRVMNAIHVAHDLVSLRRDAKLPAAPSSSLAKAGSILTKAVGNLVGSSSGSAVTQVPQCSPSTQTSLVETWAGHVSSLGKGSVTGFHCGAQCCAHAAVQVLCRMIGASLIPATAEEVISMAVEETSYRWEARVRCVAAACCKTFVYLVSQYCCETRVLQVIIVMLGGGNWAEEAQVHIARCPIYLSVQRHHMAQCKTYAAVRFVWQLLRLLLAPKKQSACPTKAHHFIMLVLIWPQVLYCASELLSPQQFVDEVQAAGRAMPA
jgi:hypothetical protein